MTYSSRDEIRGNSGRAEADDGGGPHASRDSAVNTWFRVGLRDASAYERVMTKEYQKILKLVWEINFVTQWFSSKWDTDVCVCVCVSQSMRAEYLQQRERNLGLGIINGDRLD